jgi:TatA/E family protein of Tat protein translocase
MGTLGVQEMVIIVLVALVLFGPKKLPELGRTIGKALTEFRRASSDLRATFEREMQTLDRENQSIKEVTNQVANEIYDRAENYMYDDPAANADQPAALPEPNHTSTVGASEVSSAESNGTIPATQAGPATEAIPAIHAAEGTVARTETPEAPVAEASQHS